MNEQQPTPDEPTGDMVIHNPEQVEVMNSLEALRVSFGLASAEVASDSLENESLYAEAKLLNWSAFTCTRAERWIDNAGKLGWRCYANVPAGDKPPSRIMAAMARKLSTMGWDACEVVPA